MIISYLKYLFSATNQHGVHSPFVYNLVTQCIYQKTSKDFTNAYYRYTKPLTNSLQTITITDFGAGSKKFNSNQRKVKDILNVAATKLKYAALLNRLVRYLNVQSALELGTSLGVGTYSLGYQNTQVKIDTIEGCSQILSVAEKCFKQHNLDSQINAIPERFEEALNLLQHKTYDLIFIDGNHQKNATIQYFENCLNNIHNHSVVIFDDIYWSKEMEAAWISIKNHPKVTVSIDLFQFGIVFFRKEQVKQHFKIRF